MVAQVMVAACGGDDDGGSSSARSLISIMDMSSSGGVVNAWLYDRDLPGEVPAPELGGCLLDTDGPGFSCDPACADGQICAPDQTCVERQRAVGAGALTITGTSAGTLELTPNEIGAYGYSQQQSLLGNADHVEVSASGSDEVDAFEIDLDTPTARSMVLQGATDPGWPALNAGEDLELTWSGTDPDSRIRVHLLDDAGAAMIRCDAIDNGAFTVPGDLVSGFLSAAVWSDDADGVSMVGRYRQSTVELDDGHRILLDVTIAATFAIPEPL
jgi:hypothetical protein